MRLFQSCYHIIRVILALQNQLYIYQSEFSCTMTIIFSWNFSLPQLEFFRASPAQCEPLSNTPAYTVQMYRIQAEMFYSSCDQFKTIGTREVLLRFQIMTQCQQTNSLVVSMFSDYLFCHKMLFLTFYDMCHMTEDVTNYVKMGIKQTALVRQNDLYFVSAFDRNINLKKEM